MSNKIDCYVYVIEQVGTGLIKIGMSTNVKARLSSLRTSSPYKLNLAGVFHYESVEQAAKAERWLHNIFARCKVRNEWFQCPPENVLHIFDRDISFSIFRAIVTGRPLYPKGYIAAFKEVLHREWDRWYWFTEGNAVRLFLFIGAGSIAWYHILFGI